MSNKLVLTVTVTLIVGLLLTASMTINSYANYCEVCNDTKEVITQNIPIESVNLQEKVNNSACQYAKDIHLDWSAKLSAFLLSITGALSLVGGAEIAMRMFKRENK